MISSASMSLDGFVAYPDNSPGALFDWYNNGDVDIENAGELPPFRMTHASADYWRGWIRSVGVLVVGRTLFDVTDGWHGLHPLDVPVVVLTHEPPRDWSYPGSENFTFVTTGIAEAIARARDIAGEKDVGVAAGTIATQALDAGLLDAVAIDLVPVVLGAGHPYFTGDRTALLADPSTVMHGRRVTHLVFPVAPLPS